MLKSEELKFCPGLGLSSSIGKNRKYQVSVRGFKSQFGRIYFGRSYREYSLGKSVTDEPIVTPFLFHCFLLLLLSLGGQPLSDWSYEEKKKEQKSTNNKKQTVAYVASIIVYFKTTFVFETIVIRCTVILIYSEQRWNLTYR